MVKRPKVLCQVCDTEIDADEGFCRSCGVSFGAIDTDSSEWKIICPRCQSTNNTGTFFCYACGKYFTDIEKVKTGRGRNKRGRGALLRPAPKAKVIMPDGAEITLTGAPVFIERSDFDRTLPHDILMTISRQHILITYSRCKYYLQDYGHEGKGSTNHTRLNGVDIYSKKKKALKDGDKIELAGQQELTMTFRLLQEPK